MATSTALLASAFVSMLGLNTHLTYDQGPYTNTAVVKTAIQYLGVKNLRDCPQTPAALSLWPDVAGATGARFDLYLPRSSPDAVQISFSFAPQLAASGVLNYMEGIDEPDSAYPMSVGNSISYAAWFQQQVYATAKSYGLGVINLSVGEGWTAANGWVGDYPAIGNLAAYADYANAHTYPYTGSSQPYATIARLNYLAGFGAVGRPVITTEMGWNTSQVAPDDVAANMLNGIMDSALLGDTKTYLYALFDDDSWDKFGLMNADGTPRPAGLALHNLTTILADSGANFDPGSVTYSITGLTGNERTLALAKSDGSRWLAIWDETSPTHGVTVTLPTTAAQLQVYTPKTSASAIQTVSNAQSVSVNLGGSPALIKIVPASASPPPQPPVTTTVFSTASGTTFNATSSTATMLIYGTGDTINAGPATQLIQAFSGGNTINGSTGNATISIANSGNTINVGSGTTRINDSGINDVIGFSNIGGGMTDVYGYIFENGAKLNLKPLMAKTAWDGNSATLGNFLQVRVAGDTATITVRPSGLTGGVSQDFVALHGESWLTLATLVPNAILR